MHPKAVAVLQDWYDTANAHDQKQFNQLFGELSEYKRDHYDEIVARATTARSARSSHSRQSFSSRLSALSQRSTRSTGSEKKTVTAEERQQRARSFLGMPRGRGGAKGGAGRRETEYCAI